MNKSNNQINLLPSDLQARLLPFIFKHKHLVLNANCCVYYGKMCALLLKGGIGGNDFHLPLNFMLGSSN